MKKEICSKEDHYRGLSKWVADYKIMRKAGNVKDAIKIRDQIKTIIIAENLDAEQVWETDWPKS